MNDNLTIFVYRDGSVSGLRGGQRIEFDALEISRSGSGYNVKLTEPNGRTTEYSRAGATESPAATSPAEVDRVRAQVEEFFRREDAGCDD